MAARTTRELAAELELLRAYDQTRDRLRHDFGNGARGKELNRRRRELESAATLEELEGLRREPLTADELAAAYRRVGAPRARRADRDAARYGSRGALLTARAWNTIAGLYGLEEVR